MNFDLKSGHESGTFVSALFAAEYARPSDRSFAAGTQILLADGTTKNIEKLSAATSSSPKSGDVLLSLDGVQTYVVGLMKGPEKPPLVFLQAEVISTVGTGTVFETSINESHAVMIDQSHLVSAARLRVGDQVQTVLGAARITKKERRDYAGVVWNVFLSSKEFAEEVLPRLDPQGLFTRLSNSLLGLTPKQHLLFGDGILSGDWNIQEQLDSQYRQGVSISSFA